MSEQVKYDSVIECSREGTTTTNECGTTGTRRPEIPGRPLYGHPTRGFSGANERQGGFFRCLRRAVRRLCDDDPLHTRSNPLAHSGSELVAEHASKRVHRLLAKRPEFHQRDYAAAIRGALADEDGLLLESLQHDSGELAVSGSTAAVCVLNLTKGELVVSNLGDSHVILAERDPRTEHPYHIVRHDPWTCRFAD